MINTGELLKIYLQNSLSLSILILLIIATTPLLSRRYSAKCRYYMWLVVMAALIIPVRPQIQIHLPQAYQLFAPESTETLSRVVNNNGVTALASTKWDWWQAGKILWIVGVLCFLGWHTFQHLRFMAAVRRWSEDIYDTDIQKSFMCMKSEFGIKHQIAIRSCPCVKTPMMVGLLKPVILLPQISFDSDELPFILKHELVHYIRKDLWYKMLLMLVLTIHWFNPMIHLLAKSVLNLCELSCDEEVLRGADAKCRVRYGETIIGVIQRGTYYQTSLSSHLYSRTQGVKARVYAIMDMKSKRFSRLIFMAVVVLTFCGSSAFILSSPAEQTAFNSNQTVEVSTKQNPLESGTSSINPASSSNSTENSGNTNLNNDVLSSDENKSTKDSAVTEQPQLLASKEYPAMKFESYSLSQEPMPHLREGHYAEAGDIE